MSRRGSRFLGSLLSLALAVGMLPIRAMATEYAEASAQQDATVPSPQVIAGEYTFSVSGEGATRATDTFVYRDDCFEKSSLLGCPHLAELSMQLSEASASWFDSVADTSQSDRNVVDMLAAMGFDDVETNAYYRAATHANSLGVAIARRTVYQDGDAYTLLVLVPRSKGYGYEWIGNATVGDGPLHQGFQRGRDEALRFARQYVERHGIEGKLKVWVTGHSRGGAVANLVGGFLVDGGVSYLGPNLSLSPEDIYCYCYETPSAIRQGATRAQVLSVAASTETDDTPGDGFESSAEGEIDPQDDTRYACIRNYIASLDVVPMLPLSTWGFTRFGETFPLDGGVVGVEEMAARLAAHSPMTYARFENGGDLRGFSWVRPDVLNIDLNHLDGTAIPLTSAEGMGDADIEQLIERRVSGLGAAAPTSTTFVNDGYQDALQAMMALVVAAEDRAMPTDLSGVLAKDGDKSLAKSLVFGYLNYASQRLQTEGRASNDAEALVIVVNDLLTLMADEQVDAQTVDQLVVALAQVLVAHEDTPLVTSFYDKLAAFVPDDKVSLVLLAIGQFNPAYTPQLPFMVQSEQDENGVAWDEDCAEWDEDYVAQRLEELEQALELAAQGESEVDAAAASDQREVLRDTLPCVVRALLNGPEEGSLAAKTHLFSDGVAVRRYLYTAAGLFLDTTDEDARSLIGTDASGNLDGSAPTANLAAMIIEKLLSSQNADGSYASLDEASDALFTKGVQSIASGLIAYASQKYGIAYSRGYARSLMSLANHPTQVKSLVFNTLFTVEGQPYSTAYNLTIASTMFKSAPIFALAHCPEAVSSWMRAVKQSGRAEGDHELEPELAIFTDVDDTTPHHEDIYWLAEREISTGWPNGDGTRQFRGTKSVVRQDMAAFLYRLAGSPTYEPTDEEKAAFADVDETTPHAKEIWWLASVGISKGWPEADGTRTFRGTSPIARQDCAAFLRRLAAKQLGIDTTLPAGFANPFADISTDTPHYEDVLWLANSGVSTGWMVGKRREFRGTSSILRQDMAAFLHRLDNLRG